MPNVSPQNIIKLKDSYLSINSLHIENQRGVLDKITKQLKEKKEETIQETNKFR